MLKMISWELKEDGLILTVAHTAPNFRLEYEVKLDVDDFEMLSKHSGEWFDYWNKHGNLQSFNSQVKTEKEGLKK